MTYTVPLNEDARSAAAAAILGKMQVPDPRLNAITDELANVCGYEVVLVSILAGEKRHILAGRGIDSPSVEERSGSFCAHVILSDKPLIVTDARRDPAFRDNPNVLSGPRLRSYVGAPIVLPNGLRVGTICMFDRRAADAPPSDERMDLLAEAQDEIVAIWRKMAPVEHASAHLDFAAFLQSSFGALIDILGRCRTDPALRNAADLAFADLRSLNGAISRQADPRTGDWRVAPRAVGPDDLVTRAMRIAEPILRADGVAVEIDAPASGRVLRVDPGMIRLALLLPVLRLGDQRGATGVALRVRLGASGLSVGIRSDGVPAASDCAPVCDLVRRIVQMHSGSIARDGQDGSVAFHVPSCGRHMR